ncbi:type I phosphodiesterase/nucleotide pyrophosphatase [Candidatus Moduliflexus flocculans]|uniref:Type I phosphodiesterase/nucleotide pyrophosphatase n=1 Tax=Candidatus Moduliflexus flocculans TaxID=1499966 RepID=A0A081BN24_9BACT|nr:type I phosphodiesterase/nucleotide pyrophosphatase [Candidatus Moduliflexus flocculans]
MERLARKLLLVGWDGADWKMINQLLDAGQMPTLENLINQGVMGKLTTLDPPFSPMLWTTIATGKLADKHGILGFTEPMPDRLGVRPVSSTSRKVKAFWNILTQCGLKTHVIGWWPSHPAEPINGICISNHYQRANHPIDKPWPMLPGTVHPPELSPLFAWLRVHPAELTAAHILPFVPEAARINQDQDKHLDSLARILADSATVHAAATWILENQHWDCFTVYYDAIDHFSHGFMNFHPPRMQHVPEEMFELYKDVVCGGYRFHDMMLARLVELAGDDATIMLISDHGFHSDHLRPGFLPKEPAGPAYQHRTHGIFVLKGPHIQRDELVFGASLLDITPTLLTLFGLPIGADMDGKPLVQAFDHQVSVEQISSWEDVPGECGMHPKEFIENPYDAQASLQQLVELGYIEPPDDNMQKNIERVSREADYNLARVYLGSNRPAEALPLLERLDAQMPGEARFALRLARCYKDTNRFADARTVIRQFREQALRHQQTLREKYGNIEHDAAISNSTHQEISANSQPPQENEEKQLRERAEAPHSFRQMQQALMQCELLEGEILLAEHHPKKALEHYQRLERTMRAYRPAFFLRIGEAYLKLRRWKLAEEAFRRGLRHDADNSFAHDGLAVACLRQKKYEKAIDEALIAINLAYHSPQAHFHLGEALMRSGDAIRAAEAFEVCLRMSPEFGQARNSLIDLYTNQLYQPEKAAAHQSFFVQKNTLTAANNVSIIHDRIEVEPVATATAIPTTGEQVELGTKLTGRSNSSPIIVVSGLPRSGTSMMMQMLMNGGLPILADNARPADESNPNGYYEYEAVKRLDRENAWLKNAEGKAIKIVAQLLFFLPARYNYKIIFMLRDMNEIIRSQQAMLARQGKTGTQTPSAAILRRNYQRIIAKVMRWSDAKHNVSLLYLNYADVVQHPQQQAEQIHQFLDGTLNPVTMAAVVDAALYREKS